MAEHVSDHSHGQMDIHQQQAAFRGFVTLTKWGSLASAVLILFATLWFCTSAGFMGALIPAIVVTAVGVAVLREKPGAAGAH